VKEDTSKDVAVGFDVLAGHYEGEVYVVDDAHLREISMVYDPANLHCKVLKPTLWQRLCRLFKQLWLYWFIALILGIIVGLMIVLFLLK
jgi:hypothetical protein